MSPRLAVAARASPDLQDPAPIAAQIADQVAEIGCTVVEAAQPHRAMPIRCTGFTPGPDAPHRRAVQILTDPGELPLAGGAARLFVGRFTDKRQSSAVSGAAPPERREYFSQG